MRLAMKVSSSYWKITGVERTSCNNSVHVLLTSSIPTACPQFVGTSTKQAVNTGNKLDGTIRFVTRLIQPRYMTCNIVIALLTLLLLTLATLQPLHT